MAFSINGTVLVFTADTDVSNLKGLSIRVRGIKCVTAGNAVTFTLKKTNTSGSVLYTKTLAANNDFYERVCFRVNGELFCNMTLTLGTLYVYCE